MYWVEFWVGFLVALLAVAAVLYSQGLWDTWEDKRAEVVAEVKADVQRQLNEAQDPTIDVEIAMEYGECVANAAVDVAIAGECPLDGMKPATAQIKECASSEPTVGLYLMMAIFKCGEEAQAKHEAKNPTP